MSTQDTKDSILMRIDDATHPDAMTQEEALEFLEELSSDIEARIDGLKSDVED